MASLPHFNNCLSNHRTMIKPLTSLLVESNTRASTALAAAIGIHTVEESFQAPTYQTGFGLDKTNTVTEVLMDSLPIFVVLPLSAYATKYLSWIRDTLTMVALFHPFLDHVVLTLMHKRKRPGSLTALGLMLPLGVLNISSRVPSIGGGGLGILISIFLYVAAEADVQDILKRRQKKG